MGRFAFNLSTVIGILGGVGLVMGSILLTAPDVQAYINLPGLLIVLGGTFAATFVSYPLPEVLRVLKVFMLVWRAEGHDPKQDVEEIARVAALVFRGQVMKADEHLSGIRNPFLRTGMQMVIDNKSAEDILEWMQWRIERMKARERAEANIFRNMAQFAPAFGMLGTLIGLINMLYGMDAASFEDLGRSMGIALITTLYGVLLANLLFRPVALKLERRSDERVMLMNLMLEGVLMIQERRSPNQVRDALMAFLTSYDDEIRERPGASGRRRRR